MYDMEDEEQSVTDTSEDSIDVRVKTISNPPSAKKNKRKSLEPKRLTAECDTQIKRCRLNSTGSEERSPVGHNNESRSPSPGSPHEKLQSPKRRSTSPMCLAPKKRFKFDALKELEEAKSEVKEDTKSKCPSSPFRPWSGPSESKVTPVSTTPTLPPVPYIPFLLGGMDPTRLPILPIDPRLYPSLPIDPRLLPPYMPMPTSPDAKSLTSPMLSSPLSPASGYSLSPTHPHPSSLYPPEQDEPLSLVKKDKSKEQNDSSSESSRPSPVKPRESIHKPRHTPTKPPVKRPGVFHVDGLMGAGHASHTPRQVTPPLPPTSDRLRNDSGSTSGSSGEERSKQRNYKNMTRERRVEANARERQRVHTITAAFDNLQAAIPQDDDNSKLSKLSVIKIATAYIMALSRMAGHDYTEDQSAPPVEDVIRHCSEVIEEEQRQKKRSSVNVAADKL